MSKILQAKAIADSCVHCGDYGHFYYDTVEKIVYMICGDADFDEEYNYTPYDELKSRFNEIGLKFDIFNEYTPDEFYDDILRYVLISCGIELVINYDSFDEETGNYLEYNKETVLLSAEQLLLLTIAIKNERIGHKK